MGAVKQGTLFNVRPIKKIEEVGRLERIAVKMLFEGSHLLNESIDNRGYRLYDRFGKVQLEIQPGLFQKIKNLLKEHPKMPAAFLICRRSVRALHGNCFYKKMYRLDLLRRRCRR